jgi:hypothetical protein
MQERALDGTVAGLPPPAEQRRAAAERSRAAAAHCPGDAELDGVLGRP